MVHGDLLQISVEDHYTRLSYKTLSSFIWTNRFCGNARYVAKIDDDITMDQAGNNEAAEFWEEVAVPAESESFSSSDELDFAGVFAD